MLGGDGNVYQFKKENYGINHTVDNDIIIINFCNYVFLNKKGNQK